MLTAKQPLTNNRKEAIKLTPGKFIDYMRQTLDPRFKIYWQPEQLEFLVTKSDQKLSTISIDGYIKPFLSSKDDFDVLQQISDQLQITTIDY